MSFGENLKKIRQDKKITQKELADKLDMSVNTISSYEQGNRTPSDTAVTKISDFFKVDRDKLLFESTTPVGLKAYNISKLDIFNRLEYKIDNNLDVEDDSYNPYIYVDSSIVYPEIAGHSAYYIHDQSMNNIFKKGDFVVIDGGYEKNNFVVIEYNDEYLLREIENINGLTLFKTNSSEQGYPGLVFNSTEELKSIEGLNVIGYVKAYVRVLDYGKDDLDSFNGVFDIYKTFK